MHSLIIVPKPYKKKEEAVAPFGVYYQLYIKLLSPSKCSMFLSSLSAIIVSPNKTKLNSIHPYIDRSIDRLYPLGKYSIIDPALLPARSMDPKKAK